MLLQHAPRSLSRSICLIRRNLADITSSTVPRGGSCAPTQVEECPPCRSAPPPPCREPATTCPRGLRVTCCPPAAGQRPPCPSPPPSRPRTCGNYKKEANTRLEKSETNMTNSNIHTCEGKLDRVARRLAAAEQMRRQDYENEVLSSSPAPKQPPVSTYRLACGTQSMRATDGLDYTVKNTSMSSKCSDPSRTPPLPSAVELEANTGCHIKEDSYLDPCSHQPRIFVEIDRSASKANIESDNKCVTNLKAQQTKRESLSSESNVSNKNKNNWCSNLPPPKNVPPPCKEPSLIERLRRRSSSASDNTCSRKLHTYSVICGPPSLSCMSVKQKAVNKTTAIPQEESQLAEAARGRVTIDDIEKSKQRQHSGGGFDLKIPPTSGAVQVQVSFDVNTASPTSCTNKRTLNAATNTARHGAASTTDHWLSIKSLKKKFKSFKHTKNSMKYIHTEKGIACGHPNINQSKPSPRAQHSQSKHNDFSHPQTNLIAVP